MRLKKYIFFKSSYSFSSKTLWNWIISHGVIVGLFHAATTRRSKSSHASLNALFSQQSSQSCHDSFFFFPPLISSLPFCDGCTLTDDDGAL